MGVRYFGWSALGEFLVGVVVLVIIIWQSEPFTPRPDDEQAENEEREEP